MAKKSFDKSELDVLVDEVTKRKPEEFAVNLSKLEEKLDLILCDSLELSKWSAEHFLSLVVGLYFVGELKNRKVLIEAPCHFQLLPSLPDKEMVRNFHNPTYILSKKDNVWFLGYYVNQALKCEISVNEVAGLSQVLEPILSATPAQVLDSFRKSPDKLTEPDRLSINAVQAANKAVSSYHATTPDAYKAQGTLLVRPLSFSDVPILVEEIDKLFTSKLSLLNSKAKLAKINNKALPILWVELAEEKNVLKVDTLGGYTHEMLPRFMKKLIILKHYRLDPHLAEKGAPRGLTCDITSAAQLLSKHLGQAIDTTTLLEICVDSDIFAAYLDREEIFETRVSSFRPAAQIRAPIEGGEIDLKYPYYYQGLVKLFKVYDDHAAFNGTITRQTVKHLRDGGHIAIEQQFPMLVMEPSLSEWILGGSLHVKRGANMQIPREKLRFRQEELLNFIKKCKEEGFPFSSETNSESGQQLSRSAIKNCFEKVTISAWEKIFHREKINGFITAKIPNSKPYKYHQKKVEMWLIENNYYSKAELLKA